MNEIVNKFSFVVLLKDKKSITIVNALQKILNYSKRKSNEICVDKGSEFYNRPMKSWKSVVAEIFIRTLMNKIHKHMTSISKNVYIDKLDDIVNGYNNAYHKTIKMKPIDVKDDTYIYSKKEVDDKGPKFKVGGHEYQNTKMFLLKDILPIGLKKFL